MKIKPTAIAVGVFIFLLLFAAFNASAEPGFRVALGRTVVNSATPWGEFGYEFPNGWELAGSVSGAGDTARGPQGEVSTVSWSRIVRPDWWLLGGRNYYRLGVAYVDGSPLIGNSNFRLGIGLEYRVFQVEYFHYSSAGIHQPNTGVDGLQLRFTY